MDKQILKAQERKLTGRKVEQLRREGILPMNIYGKKIKSFAIQAEAKDFEEVFEKTGETGLIEVQVDGDNRPVLAHNVQTDPVTDQVIHVDLLQVDLKQKVTANIPVEITGEAPAEKQGLGTLVQYIDEVEVEALPTDLPEKFEVDASGLTEVDQAIFVKNLVFDKAKVDVKKEKDEIIAKIEPLREEKEEVPPPTEEVPAEEVKEGEVPGETKEGATEEAPKKEEKGE